MEVKQEVQDADEFIPLDVKRFKSDELRCELCGLFCSSISDLQSHTLQVHVPMRKPSSTNNHSPPLRVCCQQCDDSFDSFAQFAAHMSTHLTQVSAVGSSSSAVPAASTSSPTSSCYPSSLSAATTSASSMPPEILGALYCPICPLMTFREPVARLEHITIHHLQVRLPQNVCNDCDVVLASPSQLSTHYTQFHLRIRFECSCCSFVGDSERSFKEHSKLHFRQTMAYGCAACSSTFRTQQMLFSHVRLCHDHDSSNFNHPPSSTPLHAPTSNRSKENSAKTSKVRILQCSVCDESVVGEDGLDEHRLLRHCKVRYADKCADCKEPILNEEQFVDHCTRHSADMTIHCPICRQSLRSENQIHAHKNYHMAPRISSISNENEAENGFPEEVQKEFPFVCPNCGEKFDDALKLFGHARDHEINEIKK